jgi:hypothetical protein
MLDYALASINCEHTCSVEVGKTRDKLHRPVGAVNAFSLETESG